MAEVKKLIKGYRDFYKKYFEEDNSLYKNLSLGQSPKTLVIACADSRVDPSIVTNADPGDIFVIRNVANLVPPCEEEGSYQGVSAALEFGVKYINVKHIVVMGHGGCAGIHALRGVVTNERVEKDHISKWVSISSNACRDALDGAVGKSDEEKQLLCEKTSILVSLNNLLTFPWIKSRVESGELKIHGWYFSIKDGMLKSYNPLVNEFEDV